MVDKNITRTDLLNHLAEKYKLERYLEIGVQVPELNFDKIKCKYKVGVDPTPDVYSDHGTIYEMTSDRFLNEVAYTLGHNDRQFDLIFIDGLHTAEQAKKDFGGCLKYLSPNGFIVLHDCNPLKEEHTIVPRPTERGHWNGDVYKFACAVGKYPKYTVDIDNGCTVVQPLHNYFNDGIDWPKYIDWDFFDANRKELLNLITWDEFISLDPHV